MINKIRVGITIGLHAPDESLWNNGIKQNALYLFMALEMVPQVLSVVLLNTTNVPITNSIPWDTRRWPTVEFEAGKDNLDILIELGGQISAEQTAYLKERGTRLISYACGSEYVSAMESVIFGRQLWIDGRFFNSRFDAVWIIPQIEESTRGYYETILRCRTSVVPFVWSPALLEDQAKSLPFGGLYQSRGKKPARISVMEPNHNVVKFCLNPVMIVEQAYRAAPDLIEKLQVTNAFRIAQDSYEFIALMNQMDVVRDHKAVFLDRFTTPDFLALHTDIVVSHQWGNPLNYFYFDVCWQGYPLIHNASLAPDLGYFYNGSNVAEGCKKLLLALREHDQFHAEYRADQRRNISRFLSSSTAVTEAYARLLADVVERPLR